MQTYPKPGRLEFSIDGNDSTIHVKRYCYSEAMSELFQLSVDIIVTDLPLDVNALLGKPCLLSVRQLTDAPQLSAVVSSVELLGKSNEARAYRILAVPQVWPMTMGCNHRIFQNLSALDIVEQLLKKRGVTARVSTAQRPPARTYCAQYRESDWAFISRLLQEEGYFYFFSHGDEQHELVIANESPVHPLISGAEPSLPFKPSAVTAPKEEAVRELCLQQTVRPDSLVHRDYNLQTPKVSLEVSAKGPEKGDIEHYEYPGAYADVSHGNTLAEARIRELNVPRLYGRGTSTCLRFLTGHMFHLRDYVDPMLDGQDESNPLLIISATHFGEQEVLEKRKEERFRYENEFSCIRRDDGFKPARRLAKPAVMGMQTATVVGPSGQEIYADETGRVRVQFHWDREGKQNENSSCWVPVMQRWAGPGFGTQFTPRIGQEVVVNFLDGDPDRPIIVGQVYHPANPPPYPPDGSPGVSAIKTRSTPGGSAEDCNEIRFTDDAGSEELFVQAQKDKVVNIKNDLSRTVGNNTTIAVKGTHTETIDGDTSITVTEGNHSLTVATGNQTTSIAGNRSESIGGSQTETVTMASAETVGLAKALTVGGAYQVSVGAVANTTVAGAVNLSAGAAHAEQVGGTKSVTVGKQYTETVAGDKKITIGKKLSYTIKDAISIVSGKARFGMKDDGKIKIEGTSILLKTKSGKIEMDSSGNITIKGSKVKVN